MKKVYASPGRYEGEEVRGSILGYKNNRIYRWTACKCCGKCRWIDRNLYLRDKQPICDSCCRSAKGEKFMKSYNKSKAKESAIATKPIQKDTAAPTPKPQQLSLDCSTCPHKNGSADNAAIFTVTCLNRFEERKIELEKTTAELEQVKAELAYALEENEKQAAEIKEKDEVIKTLRLSEKKILTDQVFNNRVASLAK